MTRVLLWTVTAACAAALTACGSAASEVVARPVETPSPAATPSQYECAGTGIGSLNASHSIDLGDARDQDVAVAATRGQTIWIGANSCENFVLPPARAVQPVLMEQARTSAPFGVTYLATLQGRATVVLACGGAFCRFQERRIIITVS